MLVLCVLAGGAWAPPARSAEVTGAHANLALHRPTTGSPICKPGEEAEKAVNGLITSKTQDKFCSLQQPSWLRVDLQSVRTLHGFTLRHAGAGGEPVSMNTRAFAISISHDGRQWARVVSVRDNTADVSRHPIAAARARYVRLDVTVPTQDGDPATRIYELEAW
jgi:mannosyl-glycoprotein endo-beta-N-acetylglucosaminidase